MSSLARRALLLLLILFAVCLVACAGELPRNDGAATSPDLSPTPDQTQSPPDHQPSPSEAQGPVPDGYQAMPFGCVGDSDCFGELCCPTPWGVKLCAPSCELR